MGYVYKFVDYYNEVIYIGKTQNILKRMRQHFFNGHLDKSCYENVNRIFIIEIDGKTNMDMYESFLINKYIPKYNVDKQFKEILDLHHNDFLKYKEVEWQEIFINFSNGTLDISKTKKKPLYYNKDMFPFEKCLALLNQNINNMLYRKGMYSYYLKNNIDDFDDFYNYLYRLHKDIIDNKNIVASLSDFDEPINEANSFEYVAFNISKITSPNVKYLLMMYRCGLITRINNDIYGIVVHNKYTLSSANRLIY